MQGDEQDSLQESLVSSISNTTGSHMYSLQHEGDFTRSLALGENETEDAFQAKWNTYNILERVKWLFPILKWSRDYEINPGIKYDFVAGLTVGEFFFSYSLSMWKVIFFRRHGRCVLLLQPHDMNSNAVPQALSYATVAGRLSNKYLAYIIVKVYARCMDCMQHFLEFCHTYSLVQVHT